MTLPLLALDISGADLALVPEDERVLLIQLGHLHNTTNLLRRWLLSAQVNGKSGPAMHAALAQHSLAARMLAGCLCEGWLVLERSFFGPGVSKSYLFDRGGPGPEALRSLKKYFSGPNLLKTVRDRFAFHFDRDEILRQLQHFTDSDTSPFYVSEERGNSLYYLCEAIVGLSVLSADGTPINRQSLQSINDRLHEDLLDMSGAFDTFIGEYLAHALRRHIPVERWERAREICVTCHSVDRLELPFFLARPEPPRGA